MKMRLEDLVLIRDEISALLLDKVDGNYSAEADLIGMASRQLEQMTCMGGSTRAKGESQIVRLIRRFDDTRDSGLGPWPVSKYMMERDARADELRAALKSCIAAHKTGRYEPLVAAIESAENLLADHDEDDACNA